MPLPKVDVTNQPFNTIYVGDTNQPVGYIHETGGIEGTTTTTTTYHYDAASDKIVETVGTPIIVMPVDKVITKGLKSVTEIINKVEPTMTYRGDDTSSQIAGTVLSTTNGTKGYTEKITSYQLTTDGNVIETIVENIVNPTETIIVKSTAPKFEETETEKRTTYYQINMTTGEITKQVVIVPILKTASSTQNSMNEPTQKQSEDTINLSDKVAVQKIENLQSNVTNENNRAVENQTTQLSRLTKTSKRALPKTGSELLLLPSILTTIGSMVIFKKRKK